MLAEAIRALRARAGLSPEAFAQLTGIAPATVTAWEHGRAEPSASEADAVARAFGVRMRHLSLGGGWPLERLLFRAREAPGLISIAESGAWRAIGEFLRATSDLAELAPTTMPALPKIGTPRVAHAPWGADDMAQELRDRLGLDPIAPILSMRALVAGLGITVFFVTPDELDPNIDGASTLSPRPAILVNLLEGPACWWRTRMILAHELCHLLVDHDAADSSALVSASGSPARYRLFDGFDEIESRANAFAACLLAPDAGVRRAAAGSTPTSEAAIAGVATAFGLGRVAAINRLRDVFKLRKETRDSMMSRAGDTWSPEAHPDIVEHVGIRAGEIRSLTLEALAAHRIDALRARELLGLPLTEPIPEWPGLSEQDRQPLRSPDDQARRTAQRYLFEVERRPDLVVTEARRVDTGWIAKLEGSDRELHVSFDLDVVPAAA